MRPMRAGPAAAQAARSVIRRTEVSRVTGAAGPGTADRPAAPGRAGVAWPRSRRQGAAS
jgi:hypothetical protein